MNCRYILFHGNCLVLKAFVHNCQKDVYYLMIVNASNGFISSCHTFPSSPSKLKGSGRLDLECVSRLALPISLEVLKCILYLPSTIYYSSSDHIAHKYISNK